MTLRWTRSGLVQRIRRCSETASGWMSVTGFTSVTALKRHDPSESRDLHSTDARWWRSPTTFSRPNNAGTFEHKRRSLPCRRRDGDAAGVFVKCNAGGRQQRRDLADVIDAEDDIDKTQPLIEPGFRRTPDKDVAIGHPETETLGRIDRRDARDPLQEFAEVRRIWRFEDHGLDPPHAVGVLLKRRAIDRRGVDALAGEKERVGRTWIGSEGKLERGHVFVTGCVDEGTRECQDCRRLRCRTARNRDGRHPRRSCRRRGRKTLPDPDDRGSWRLGP